MTGLDGTADLDRRLADALERLGNGLRSLAQRTARGHGLSPLQQQAVLALARQPQGRREVAALAKESDVTTPTMVDAIAALERKGLVSRAPTSDGRRRVLSLTGAGDAIARALSTWDDPLTTALAGVPVAERAATLQTVLDVIGGLQRSGVLGAMRTCTTCRFFGRDEHPDPAVPHHCHLLRTPIPRTALRTDCPEHEPAAG
ncbi:MarR family winged helix-turn-helix transcriptional regulator [Amycolatopsis sp. FBCC-B4732]|uniref:MarR family winged helix-turn-helix transcriptional regulator n=1 Tax=Amycolatopsis sp. FBCC-B4732 TaxID=3079339 RepID=UPI001FF35105|nr:MarR family winged helix-turn-helix transcriptional regulator [Amycolatopsis sp. FBCC-B4732]UOX91048.1 MarR family winged helix-turn-helix transcriptional regulator [Amycolatopsis sp. FBCC-B4732]